MAERTRRRRGHPAASARVLTAGFSSAAALGMVAGMAVPATAGPRATPLEAAAAPTDGAAPPPGATATAPSEMVMVIRRHWLQVPSGPATPAARTAKPTSLPAATPGRTGPPTAAPAAPTPAPRPAPRPVTRTRGS